MLLDAYNQAAMRAPSVDPGCTGMRRSILAGIGMVESSQAAGHQISPDGEVTPPVYGVPLNGSGAGGNTTPVDGSDSGSNGDGVDTAPPTRRTSTTPPLTTAAILCGGGTRNLNDPAQLAVAILSCNHSQAYVAEVESWIASYGQLASTAGSGRRRQSQPHRPDRQRPAAARPGLRAPRTAQPTSRAPGDGTARTHPANRAQLRASRLPPVLTPAS